MDLFQDRKMVVKWRGLRRSIPPLNGGGPQGGTVGIIEYTGCPIETEQKYWLITRARINFRGQTICHFFTDTRTFWYLV